MIKFNKYQTNPFKLVPAHTQNPQTPSSETIYPLNMKNFQIKPQSKENPANLSDKPT